MHRQLQEIFVTGILGALVAVMLQWIISRHFQKKLVKFFWIPGIAISHMMALSGALIAVPLNWIFDRIPGFNKIEADSETIAKTFWIFWRYSCYRNHHWNDRRILGKI